MKVPKAVGPPRWKDERLQDQSRRNPKTLKLIQLESEPNLWKIVEEKKKEEEEGYWLTNATVLGLVMTYVDDIFVVGSDDVVGAVAQEI